MISSSIHVICSLYYILYSYTHTYTYTYIFTYTYIYTYIYTYTYTPPLHLQGGVIKVDKDGKPIPGSKAALVYGQMNEPPGARARVALTGLAIAGMIHVIMSYY
jgi:hypothetical protein